MSYLANFRAMPPRRDGARRVNLKWRSVTGSFILAAPALPGLGAAATHGALHGGAWRCHYRKHSKLGRLIGGDIEQMRHYVRGALHQHNLVPIGAAVEFISMGNR